MDNKTEQKNPRQKLFTALGIISAVALAALLIFTAVSRINSRREKNDTYGYSDFVADKSLKPTMSSPTQCTIDGKLYNLIDRIRPEYVVENKGRCNRYGYYFGDAPDLFMMNYESTNSEFWFINAFTKYPAVTAESIAALVIPHGESAQTYKGNNGISRIDFGESPIEITDKNTIEAAASEFAETGSFSYITDAAPAGTEIYAKLKDSCFYYDIGRTAEE